ncbi:MAG: hypothetical protein IPO29_13015 [Anaerolineae bacterium]|nr:hypothetical protein [Anaerolineae bacterium]
MGTLTDYLRILLRRWWLALLPVVVMAGLTVWGNRNALPPGNFGVNVRFAAGLPPERAAGVYNYDRHYDWLASEYIAQAFAFTIPTNQFAQAVSRRMLAQGVAISPSEVEASLRADHTSSVIKVSMSWRDAGQLEKMAEAVSAELTENGAAYWPQLSDPGGAPVRRLDVPVVLAAAPPLRDTFDLPVRLLIGLALGVFLAFALDAIDPVIRDRRALERLGLPSLAHIPRP